MLIANGVFIANAAIEKTTPAFKVFVSVEIIGVQNRG